MAFVSLRRDLSSLYSSTRDEKEAGGRQGRREVGRDGGMNEEVLSF